MAVGLYPHTWSLDWKDYWLLEYTKSQWVNLAQARKDETCSEKRRRLLCLAERQEKACQPIIEQLVSIYGHSDNLPPIYGFYKDHPCSLRDQFQFIFLNDADLFNLSNEEIATFPDYKILIYLHRVTLIVKQTIMEKGESLYHPCLVKDPSMAAIIRLADTWKPDHLRLFSFSELANERFPWNHLVKEREIGRALQSKYENHAEYIRGVHLPWEQLETEAVLDLFHLNILASVEIEVVQIVSQYLPIDYLIKMENHLKDSAFPWDAFLSRPGFGIWLRSYPEYLQYIPVIQFAETNLEEFNQTFYYIPMWPRNGVIQRLRAIATHDLENLFAQGYLNSVHRQLLAL